MVELNNGQKECLSKLVEWWNYKQDYQQVFSISGPAGSGKTFLIRVLIDQIHGIKLDDVLFVAYVGKAALNLSKSGLNASTIHSAIYHAIDVVTDRKDKDGNVITQEAVSTVLEKGNNANNASADTQGNHISTDTNNIKEAGQKLIKNMGNPISSTEIK